MGFNHNVMVFAIYIKLRRYGTFHALISGDVGNGGRLRRGSRLWSRHCHAGTQSPSGDSYAGVLKEIAAVEPAFICNHFITHI
jgi:hypothetical protein